METIVASMALSRLGAVQNPIIPIYREREVGFLLHETGAAFYLIPGTWRGRLPGHDAGGRLPGGAVGVLRT